jgi:malonate-semialdehyde dehydrogenase (acetylating)/methylmalonate-semialdehyde dehydrogenase
MAITTAVFLKDSRSYEQGLESMASKVRVIAGTESGGVLGPAISKQAKEHICSLVECGATDGAKLVLDGWGIKLSWNVFCEGVTQKAEWRLVKTGL